MWRSTSALAAHPGQSNRSSSLPGVWLPADTGVRISADGNAAGKVDVRCAAVNASRSVERSRRITFAETARGGVGNRNATGRVASGLIRIIYSITWVASQRFEGAKPLDLMSATDDTLGHSISSAQSPEQMSLYERWDRFPLQSSPSLDRCPA